MRWLVMLFLAGSLAGQEGVRNPRTAPEDVAAGAKTFHSHCAPCHGLKGEGGRGPNLSAGRFYHGASDADLLRNISEGIPGTEMPGIFYTEDRVWQIVAYVRSLSLTVARPRGDAWRGAELFRSKGCTGCHRVNGEGGRMGPDLSQIGKMRSIEHLRQSILEPGAEVLPRYWLASFKDGRGNAVQGFVLNEDTYTLQLMDMSEQLHTYNKAAIKEYQVEKVSKMPSYRDTMTNEEFEDMLAYLVSLGRE
jgi:cytochrome c oxidase cbb3-type subunit III